MSTQHKLDMLDIGCGTGLCGAALQPFAKSLTGVDLAPNMLAVARQKNLYDQLITADLTDFLQNAHQQYDLILGGDVLVYMGELTTLFALTAQALRPNGLFIFNTEIDEGSAFKMNQSGRFAHSKSYLATQAAEHQFAVLDYQKIITRQQNNAPVYGHLFVLQRRDCAK
jgi:predicted TPR repeat methyltransferase